MKPNLVLLLIIVAALLGGGFLYQNSVSHQPPGRINAARILQAAQAYRRDLQQQGAPLPPEVNLQTLVQQGRLRPEDIAGFAGLEATISLTADERRPQDVLMRVRFPDGIEIVTLADGSVQQFRR